MAPISGTAAITRMSQPRGSTPGWGGRIRRLRRVQHLGPVIADVAYLPVDRSHLHILGLVGAQQVGGKLAVAEAFGAAVFAGEPPCGCGPAPSARSRRW
jgi:hypothetical protein